MLKLNGVYIRDSPDMQCITTHSLLNFTCRNYFWSPITRSQILVGLLSLDFTIFAFRVLREQLKVTIITRCLNGERLNTSYLNEIGTEVFNCIQQYQEFI